MNPRCLVEFRVDHSFLVWEIPTMESVTKLDARRRGVFPAPFQPGDVLVKEKQTGETISFRLLRPADVPVATSRRCGGFTMLDIAKIPAERIAAAVRADRDSR